MCLDCNGRASCVFYYRDRGLVAGPGPVLARPRSAPPRVRSRAGGGHVQGLHLTIVPITLTRSIVFLAWDRATQEHMEVA